MRLCVTREQRPPTPPERRPLRADRHQVAKEITFPLGRNDEGSPSTAITLSKTASSRRGGGPGGGARLQLSPAAAPRLVPLFARPRTFALKAGIKGADLLAPLPNAAAFVAPGAGWLLNSADPLGPESENTLRSQQGWRCVPWRPGLRTGGPGGCHGALTPRSFLMNVSGVCD